MKKFVVAMALIVGAGAVSTAEAGPVLDVVKAVVTAPVKVVKKVQPVRKVAKVVRGVARVGAKVVRGAAKTVAAVVR
jgi:hypothetical protein